MRYLLIIIIELFIINAHFLVGRYISVNELQPIPLLVLAVFFLLKSEEELLFPSLIITGILTDLYFSQKIGPFLLVYLLCGFLFKESRNVMFKDHFLTHVFFTFAISLIGIFFIYLIGGVFTLRAPIIVAIYNAMLTPILYFVFDQIKLERLVRIT